MISPRQAVAQQSGFTIVEVMVAAMLLLVGLLATFGLVDGATRTVATSKGREGGTNLAREVLERARSLPYASLSAATVTSNVRAMANMGGGTSGPWTVARRNITYTITPTVCSLDDPGDGMGSRAGATFCPGVGAAGTADAQPEDYKRVAVTVSWKDGAKARSATVTAVRSNRSGAEAPTITAITTTAPVVTDPQAPVISDPLTSQATFKITASSNAASVKVSIDGTEVGTATPVGNGKDWTYALNVSTAAMKDGAYTVGAAAVDAMTNSGPIVTIPLTLNRVAPGAPSGLVGGRNEIRDAGTYVNAAELDWLPSEDRNVIGFRVYRPDNSLACPTNTTTIRTETWCVDTSPQTGVYGVVALYKDTAGAIKESARATVTIQAPIKTYYFTNTTNTAQGVNTANCGNANWLKDLDDTAVVGAEATLPSGNGDVIRFCSAPISATIPGGNATVSWYMSNPTNGSGCNVTVTAGMTGGTSATRSFTVPSNSGVDLYTHTIPFTSTTMSGNRLLTTWTRSNGASCSGVRVHFAGANRSRLELPRSWTAPNPPTNLATSRDADGVVTVSWAASSTPADQLFGYRVYRDGQDWTDRLGQTGDGTALSYVDANRDGGPHTYWVTAVNQSLAESTQTGPVQG